MRDLITLTCTEGPRQVEADVFGDWAVHLSHDRWVHGSGQPTRAVSITHVPSGMRASCAETVGISKREAARIARYLKRTVPTGLPVDDAFGKLVHRQIWIAVWGEKNAAEYDRLYAPPWQAKKEQAGG